MMTQEEYVNEVLALRRQGKTIVEIAEQVGYHPATISKWLKAGGPPPARTVDPVVRVIDEVWAARIGRLVSAPAEKLLASSVFEIIRAEGFDGSYPSVVRYLRELRGPRFRAAPVVSVPIETAPGQECQFDWSHRNRQALLSARPMTNLASLGGAGSPCTSVAPFVDDAIRAQASAIDTSLSQSRP